ncbi:MAG: hypothetical protein OEW21_06605 [Betaproteobacteria bacterium]|nr:hypothetical protein [Betaproteobacteria bacterium]
MLDRAARKPVIWIAAPAGYGKTMLAATYVARARDRTLWYQADGSDADAATFFFYLAGAVRGRGLPLLTPERRADLAVFARNFFRILFARLRPRWLVVDDFHEAEAGELARILAVAATELPAGATLLVLSRNDPPPEFARLRSSGALAMVGGDALRLTPQEARSIAARRRVAPAALRDAYAVSEGWAAGLLLLLERQAAEGVTAGRAAGAPVFDYFAAELLARADREERDLLLATSLLDRFTAGLAAMITGNARSPEVLAGLRRRHYFIYRYGGTEAGAAYQYHPLFRAFLRASVARHYGEAGTGELLRRAARAAEDGSAPESALALWAQARDWENLIGCIGRLAPELFATGRSRTIEDAVARMPDARRDAEPWILYWLAQCRLPVDPADAKRRLERAVDLFRARADRTGALLAWTGVVDVALHMASEFVSLDRWIAALPDIAGADPLPGELDNQVAVRMFSALALRQPQHAAIAQWRDRALAILRADDAPPLRLVAGVHLFMYFAWLGETARARECVQWLESLMRAPGIPPLMQITVQVMRAMCAWQIEADAARTAEIVDEARKLGAQEGIGIWDYHLVCHATAASLAEGDLPKARRLLRWLAAELGRARTLERGLYHWLIHWEALARGDIFEADRQQSAAQALVEPAALMEAVGMKFGAIFSKLLAARNDVASGNRAAAQALLDEARAGAGAVGSRLIECTVEFEEADLAQRAGDEAGVRRALGAAFAIMRERGLWTFHGWIPVRMAKFCAEALAMGIETEFVRRLIRRRRLAPPAGAHSENWPWPIRVETLGQFALFIDDDHLPADPRSRRKPLDMLKTLVAFGSRGATAEALAAELWPEAEGDTAANLFKVTLHRLRELLGHEALRLAEGRLSANLLVVWTDAWALERALEGTRDSKDAQTRLEAVLALYRGPFLGDDVGANIAILKYRERLRRRVLAAVKPVLAQLKQAAQWEALARLAARALEIEEIDEDLHEALVRACLGQDKRVLALQALERAMRVYADLKLPLPARFDELRRRALGRS